MQVSCEVLSLTRILVWQIVLRFAKKYIKDPEGAAVSDLQVSVSGGSVVFRNFELNLEGKRFSCKCCCNHDEMNIQELQLLVHKCEQPAILVWV